MSKKFGFCHLCRFFDEVNEWMTQPTCLYCDGGDAFMHGFPRWLDDDIDWVLFGIDMVK